MRVVLPREEHPLALDATELRRFEVRENRDLSTAQFVDRVVFADSRDDLTTFVPEVDLHDVQIVGVRVGLHVRSEEHTSELQSRPHLVCRLLLEKKKTR